jgi:hypothetical protein
MNTHPYLRAFMAGILVPTLVLPLLLIAFIVLRFGMQIFLPLLMMPVGAIIATQAGVLVLAATSVTWFNALTLPYTLIALFVAFAMSAYYLAWKYIVGFANRVLGIA